MEEERTSTHVTARYVSFRDLSRSTKAVIDEVDRDGRVFAVGRYGRLVALVVPLPDTVTLDFEGGRRGPIEALHHRDEDGIDLEELNLSDLEMDFLKEAASVRIWRQSQRPEMKENPSAATVAIVNLEMRGFLERTGGGTMRATPAGRRVARGLRYHRGP